MDSQPTVAGGRVFVGSQSGAVYALGAASGCVHWMFQAAAAVRAAVSVGQVQTRSGSRLAAFIGDRSANVYAVDAASGELLWKTRVDDFPFARVTGSPTFHNGRLYVGVASGEETAGAVADYECCKFRGSVLALDAATGTQVWKMYTIEEPRRTTKNKVGTQLWGPSGAPIWSSPAIAHRSQRGVRHDRQQLQRPGDAQQRRLHGLRYELGASAVVETDDGGRRLEHVMSAARSDQLHQQGSTRSRLRLAADHRPASERTPGDRLRTEVRRRPALDPDCNGELIWQERVGKGGINGGVQWGSAADQSTLYVALSDLGRIPVPNSQATVPDPNTGGGMFALRLDSGQRVWHTPPPAACNGRDRCSPAQSAAVSAIPGVAFSGSVDGHIRGFSATDGKIVWDFDTVKAYETVNGVPGRGGSLNVGGPAISGGMLFVNSGYVQNGTPGNVLLAFSVDGK